MKKGSVGFTGSAGSANARGGSVPAPKRPPSSGYQDDRAPTSSAYGNFTSVQSRRERSSQAARSGGSAALPKVLGLYHGLAQGRNDQLCHLLARQPHNEEDWLAAFRDAGDGTTNPNMTSIRQLRVLIWLQTQNWIIAGNDLGNPVTEFVRLGREPLDSVGRPEVTVRSADILQVAGELSYEGTRVAVLNMACAHQPGGGVRSGAGAQEENLHRRSDACRFLEAQGRQFYPIPRDACLLSRGVVVFRGAEALGYPRLIKPFKVDMISSAAPAHPVLNSSNNYCRKIDYDAMVTQIDLIIEAAQRCGCQALLLSAFGCGAFGNPPETVAQLFKSALSRCGGRLEKVVFCILNDHNSGHSHNPRGNFQPFAETFQTRERPVQAVRATSSWIPNLNHLNPFQTCNGKDT